MSISRITATVAFAAALFTATSLSAVEANDKTATVAPVINSVCPMDGKPIDAEKCPMMPMTMGEGADAKHYRMAMCSEACMTEFKKDPAAALKPVFGKGAPGPKTQYK